MSTSCLGIRRALGAYVDDELSGAERLAVLDHLEACDDCATEVESLRGIGDALRGMSAGTSALHPALAGLASGVTSRIRAEQSQSWAATWNRIFDDWHWVGVGLGSVAGALVTLVAASTMMVSATAQLEQLSARAGTLYLIALPAGGRGGAIMLEFEESLGSAKTDARMALPASLGWQAEQALVSALGEKLANSGPALSLHEMSKADREEILALLSEIADFRYMEPAKRPGGLTNVSGMHLRVETSVTASGI